MELIEEYKIQIFETLILLGIMIVVNFIIRKWSFRIVKKFHLGLERRKITLKIITLLLGVVGIIALTGIWGLDQKELFVFFTSTITVLGVAFFATWSILSNITSGILLFFNHPLHIGDNIKILDKEMQVEGKLKDISMFFMHIETVDGETITIPNSVVTQKVISISQNKITKETIEQETKKTNSLKESRDIEDPI